MFYVNMQPVEWGIRTIAFLNYSQGESLVTEQAGIGRTGERGGAHTAD